MTIVYGQIESLRKVKEILKEKGISQFNSIGDIDRFKQNYEPQRQEIISQIRKKFEDEVRILKKDENEQRDFFNRLKDELSKAFHERTSELEKRLQNRKIQPKKSWYNKVFNWVIIQTLHLNIYYRRQTFETGLKRKIYPFGRKLWEVNKRISELENNEESIISSRTKVALKDLVKIRSVVEDLSPLIAGAIGENLVAKELENLSDEYILINDFSASFDPPIYNRKENDRIFSVQIDHVVISKAGVFVIETKNWSPSSLQRDDLRSPVEQVRRTGFALYVLLNNNTNRRYGLKSHHWGEKQIPVRNLLTFIHSKPKEQFKYVQVKTLNELNGYLTYFDPIFSAQEVRGIADYLRSYAGYN